MALVWSKQRTYLATGLLAAVLLLGSLFFALQKPVVINVDGKVLEKRVVFTSTVKSILDHNHIVLGENDKVEPGLNTLVKKNTNINIIRAFKVKVIADGKEKEIISTPVTIKDAVKQAGFELGDKDIVKTLPTQMTVPNQEIEVIRVSEKIIQENQPIPYQVERTEDNTLEKGLTRTVSQGKEGVSLNSIKIIYYNNQEAKREIVEAKILQSPRNKVIALGNITAVSRGGQRLDFREARYVLASAYTYTGHNTSTGRAPAVGIVAVDPAVIPLGSRLYIEGYGYAVAADTGASITGDRIDLFMEEKSQCQSWGRKTTKVYILK